MAAPDPSRRVVAAILGICAAFAALQLVYLAHLPLVYDEFVGAHDAYHVLRETPYADYAPYKTVAGYYLQALVLDRFVDNWSGIFAVKYLLVALNAGMMAIGALTLRRTLHSTAVVASLVLWALMSTYLERSAELRVDMMTAWAGFGSLLFLLQRRPSAAGLAAGFSFLISQKGLYFCVAGACTCAWLWLSGARETTQRRRLETFCLGALTPIALYIAIWSFVAPTEEVLRAVFFSHHAQILDNVHGDLHKRFWGQSIWRNPFYYALFAFALVGLERQRREHAKNSDHDRLNLTFVYGLSMGALAFLQPKPWPYTLVFLFPTAFVVHATFLDEQIRQNGRTRWAGLTPLLAVAFVGLGVLRPLTRVPRALHRDLGHQQANVRALAAQMRDSGAYLGGVNYLYRREQAHLAFSNFDKIHSVALRRDKARQAEILEELQARPVTYVLHSTRTKRFPGPLKRYLAQDFCRLWSNLYVYCPSLAAGPQRLRLTHEGEYRVLGTEAVLVDGERVEPEQTVQLAPGVHDIDSPQPQRLRLEVARRADLDPRYAERKKFFPAVYDW